MQNKIRIGTWEGICFIILTICTQVFLNFPRLMAEDAGTAGWLLAIYVSLLSFILLIIIVKLYKPFVGKDLTDIGELVAGTSGRVFMGVVQLAYLIFIMSVVLREFSEDMKIISLPQSPISFITLFFTVGMVIGAYLGIEALTRLIAVAVPIIAAGYFIIGLGASQYNDFSRIMPVLGLGPYDVFVKGALRISVFSGILVLYLLSPYFNGYKQFKKVGFIGVGISAFILCTSVLLYLLIYNYPTAIENFLPMYQLARVVSYGRFFQRVESIFVIIWAGSALSYLSMGLFMIANIFSKTFGLVYYKPLVIPFAILLFNVSLLPPNLVAAIELEVQYFRLFAWTVTFGLTILLLLIARFTVKAKGKEGKKGEKFREARN